MTKSGSQRPATNASGDKSRLVDCLTVPVDVAWLAAFRFCFGSVMAVSMARFLAYGWVDQFFVNPRFHFKYWGFGWVEALPRGGMYAVFAVLMLSAAAMAVGYCFRLSAAIFVAGFAYVQLIDVTNYLNHYYLAWLLSCLLLVSPAGKAWSVDVWRAQHSEASALSPRSSVSRSWLFVFRLQVGVVYTYAGLAKAHSDWLIDAQPLRIWLGSLTDLPLLGPMFTWDGVPLVMSWAGFLFDTFVIWFLLWERTRWLAYLAVIVFHTMTRTLFPIGMFSTIMVTAALVFFPPDWPRRLWRALRRWAPRMGPPSVELPFVPQATTRANTSSRSWRAWCLVGAVYCAWQTLMPLRFLAYEGNVRWHEQGMRFSWRVMVREKNGSVTFLVRDPRSGREFAVAPRAYLTRLQEREMSAQPDLILQLAHRIRDDYEAEFGAPVQVRVEAIVSLNGRRAERLIDPHVDLAQVEDGLAPYRWVLPAPTTPPPRTRPV